jgi:hydrogenase nickel incorporation protein HypA/HybF
MHGMHEASLMRNLMAHLLAAAAARGATRIVAVRVQLGALSHMSAAHFHEHFVQAAAGSIAEGAAIDALEQQDIQAPGAADVVLVSFDIE